MEKELLRIAEVAEMIGLSRATVYQLIAGQQIGPVIKVGRAARIRTSDVRIWIERQAHEANARNGA